MAYHQEGSMLFKRTTTLAVLLTSLAFGIGCGGVSEGVADATDEPEPELTADEEAGEREVMREYRAE